MARFNLKKLTSLVLAALLLLCSVLFAACGKGGSDETEPDSSSVNLGEEQSSSESESETETEEEVPSSEEDTRTPAEIAEDAMDRFLEKVAAGNYVMDFQDHVKVSVVSDGLVCYEFGENYGLGFGDGVAYYKMAVMTVNENETFCAYYGENGEELLAFSGEGKAVPLVDAGAGSAAVKTRLLSYLTDPAVSDGNIWNLFTNVDPEDPLKFVGTDFNNVVRETMQIIGGLGQNAADRMEEVYLEFEEEDPVTAHLKTTFRAGLTPIPDIDIVIRFGNAEPLQEAVAWMEDESRSYPAAKTDWDEIDETNLNAIFLPGYGRKAVPFPAFASYAFTMDVSHILSDDMILMRDPKAAPEDLEAYAAALKEDGFTEVTGEDGITHYRKLLREAYFCYASLDLAYENGAEITATAYYDFPRYEGFAAVNEVVTAHGYPALPETDRFDTFSGEDQAALLAESFLYLYDYDLGLYVVIPYEDREDADAYISAYQEVLEKEGYKPAYGEAEEEDREEYEEFALLSDDQPALGYSLGAPFDENDFMELRTGDGLKTFRYHYEPDGEILVLLFKAEKYVTAEETLKQLAAVRIPLAEIPEENFVSCRDIRLFQNTMYGRDLEMDLSLALTFEGNEGTAYLDDLVNNRLVPNGFMKAGPGEETGLNKQVVYYRELFSSKTLIQYVGLSCDTDARTVFLEFRMQEE